MYALTWLLVGALFSAGHASPLTIDGVSDVYSASGHMEVLRDEDGSLSIEKVSSEGMSARFFPVAGIFNGGFIMRGAYWIRFSVAPTYPAASGAWWLALVAPLVDRLDVYIPEPPGTSGFVHEQGGALVALGTKPNQPLEVKCLA